MYSYPGNIHIHSHYSDGSGSIEEIISDAAAAGLSYIIVADHNTLAGLHEESIRQGVVLLVGVELNRDKCHYLAFGLNKIIPPNEVEPQQVINQVGAAGGIGYLAHPFEKGSPYLEKGKAYPWNRWPVFDFDGMEVWNYTSHWRGRDPSLLKTLYWFFLNRKGAMSGPPLELLRLWDCYNMHHNRIAGLGSSDAHAYPYKFGPFRVVVFPYYYLFKTINTYIVLKEELSKELKKARQQILGALKSGCCYISHDSLHAGSGFSFYAKTYQGQVYMGGETDSIENLELHVQSPVKRSQIRLIYNGRLLETVNDQNAVFRPSKPGVYRTEVYYRPLLSRSRPWIYSNPIFIKPPAIVND
ncbi:MAG: CehA/McbA family metallohydrolase [Bacillota bacterium]